MLTELRIRNYAVIDEIHVELGPGLNVLNFSDKPLKTVRYAN